MAGVRRVVTLLFTLWLAATSHADVVQYYYNLQVDQCSYGTTRTYQAQNNTNNGGLCAYVQSINRSYACPAPDPACWTWAATCANNNNTEPGTNQIKCTRGSSTWCCSNQETCTVTKNQINVCISQFQSPNSGVSVEKANAAESSAVKSIATTTVTAYPSILSVSTFQVANEGSPSTTKSSTSHSSSTASSTITGNPADPVSTIPTNSPTPSASASSSPDSNSSLSGGAIAGIVIGSVAGIALIGGAIAFFLLRRRRAHDQQYHHPSGPAPPYQHPAGGYYHEKASAPISEAPAGPYAAVEYPRAEMPSPTVTSTTSPHTQGRYELQ